MDIVRDVKFLENLNKIEQTPTFEFYSEENKVLKINETNSEEDRNFVEIEINPLTNSAELGNKTDKPFVLRRGCGRDRKSVV